MSSDATLKDTVTAKAKESNRRILIIDDNARIHDDIRRILGLPEKEDLALDAEAAALFGLENDVVAGVEFEIDSAFQGHDGLEMVQRALEEGRPYAMAFVDVRMPPGWDGVETISRVCKIDPALQVVLCTAYSEYSWQEMTDWIGHTDNLLVLKKPFDNIEALQLAHTLTRKWQLRKALVDARDEAERANNAKSQFLSNMSHELRTPLNAILGFAQLMELEETDASKRESLDHILMGGRHLLELVNEILDIARIEAGRLELSLEPINLRELLLETLSLMRPLAVRQNIELSFPSPKGTPYQVLADRKRLRQVFLNLISNAIKYNRDRGSVTVTCEEIEQRLVHVVVTDTGAGMSAKQLRRLFVPFERLDADKAGIQGAGLGLVLTKGLIEAMGGTVGVNSTPNRGTSFSVQLAMPTETLTAPPSPRAAESLPRRNILCIEDDPAIVTLIADILSRRTEVSLTSAPDGEQGLKLARDGHFDLILLDFHLPDMKGHEAFRQLQSDPRTSSIPVIVVSGDPDPAGVMLLFASDVPPYLKNPFLKKPFAGADFLAVFDEALHQNEARIASL